MAKRKTIKIEVIVERVNTTLKLTGISQTEKLSLCHFLEGILFDTGNYKGFTYLHHLDSPGFEEFNRQYLKPTNKGL